MKFLPAGPVATQPGRALQGGRAGPFVRSSRPPVQPRTTKQQIPRDGFQWAARTWVTLSEAQKDAWRAYGPVPGDGSVNIMVRNVPRVIAGEPVEPLAPGGGPPLPPVFLSAAIGQTDNVLDLLTVNIEEPSVSGASVSLYALAPQTSPDPETEDWIFLDFAWSGGFQTTNFLASYIDSFSDTFGPALWIPLRAVTTVSSVDSDPSFSAVGTPPSSPVIDSTGALSSAGLLTQLDVDLASNDEDNTTDFIFVASAQSATLPQPTEFEFATFFPYGSGALLSAYVLLFGDSVPAGYWIWVMVVRVSDFDSELTSEPVYEAIFVD